jgi:hypothetical protein
MAKRTDRFEEQKPTNADTRRDAELNAEPEEQRPSLVRRTERSDSGDAFFPDPQNGGPARAPDDLAETLAEDYVASATTGGNVDDEVLNQVVPEEIGGPFIETSPGEEFAEGYDESNPEDATVEGRPMAVAGMVERPPE